MRFLNQYYFKTLKYDLYNKYQYKNTKKLPKLLKIFLSFGCKTTEIKKLFSSLLALELITKKRGALTAAKNANISLKLRQGNPVGCKLTLTNKKMFTFLEHILIEIFPKLKNFSGLVTKKDHNKNTFCYELPDTFAFSELEEQYSLFNTLPKLRVVLVSSAIKKEELLFSVNALQLPLKQAENANMTQLGRV